MSPSSTYPTEKIQAIHAVADAREVRVAFQPIVHLGRKELFAYEVLTRTRCDGIDGPEELFAAAAQAGRVGELGRLHREEATRICQELPLFLNIDPHELDQGWLVRPDDPIFRRRAPVTLEITESVPLRFFSQCQSVLAEIRRKGILLAIDDFGAGFSNLRYVLDLEPDVIKLDRALIVGLQPGTRQYRLIEAIVELCHRMQAKVIAEGIETEGELGALVGLGVDFGQGYLLGRPANPPPDVLWPHRLF